jgi:hypothetical protein
MFDPAAYIKEFKACSTDRSEFIVETKLLSFLI